MNTRQSLLAVSAVFLLGAAAAHAESYEGVAAPVGVNQRADVAAQAVRTAAAPNQNIAAGSRVIETTSSVDRATVRAQAVRAAAAPDQNVAAGSRVNSQVISTMANPADQASQRAATPAAAERM